MILHCAIADKFIQPFIDFIELNFDFSQHFFLVKKNTNYEIRPRKNVCIIDQTISRLRRALRYVWSLNKAEKIILHGLFDEKLLWMLALQPWLLRKCYWIIWGGDLYVREKNIRERRSILIESIRSFVIKRFGHLVTYIEGDYELARKWYGATGKYHASFVYPSNVYTKRHWNISSEKKLDFVAVLAGNSADPSNDHLEIFKVLVQFKNEIKIYCPLSYGNKEYAEYIAKKGKEIFGSKFVPIMEFMPFDKYSELLEKIDLVIFAHKRQQAMGNTVTLLGMGKKVFMRSDVTHYEMFIKNDIKVFDINDFDLTLLEQTTGLSNSQKVGEQFSKSSLAEQLKSLFDYS